ncbi:hypothetical protein C8R43DRAFT_966221 [Mycena crocata]|nr:hypothetical protein C8R43DRAFT_966221 [Mycena crocata]
MPKPKTLQKPKVEAYPYLTPSLPARTIVHKRFGYTILPKTSEVLSIYIQIILKAKYYSKGPWAALVLVMQEPSGWSPYYTPLKGLGYTGNPQLEVFARSNVRERRILGGPGQGVQTWLPTVPVKTGVTGAVNGMPSCPVEPLAGEKKTGRVRDGNYAPSRQKAAVDGFAGIFENQLTDTHLLHVNALAGRIWHRLSPSHKLTVDGRLFAVLSRLKYLKFEIHLFTGLGNITQVKSCSSECMIVTGKTDCEVATDGDTNT